MRKMGDPLVLRKGSEQVQVEAGDPAEAYWREKGFEPVKRASPSPVAAPASEAADPLASPVKDEGAPVGSSAPRRSTGKG